MKAERSQEIADMNLTVSAATTTGQCTMKMIPIFIVFFMQTERNYHTNKADCPIEATQVVNELWVTYG